MGKKGGIKPKSSVITVWAALLRVSRALLEGVEADLKAADLPALVWYDVLLELKRVRPDGLRPFQLQERMLLAQYNLSRLLDRIVEAGYAERLPCPEDGRGHTLHLTPPGNRMLKRMWPVYRDAVSRRFAGKLTQAEIDDLARVLVRLGGPA